MRGGLGVRAPLRGHRRLGEFRRVAAQASSAYRALAERDRAELKAQAKAEPKPEKLSEDPPKSPARRSLFAMGTALAFVVVVIGATIFGASEMDQGAQPNLPHTVIAPNGATVTASLSVPVSSSTATNGHAPGTLSPGGSDPDGLTAGTTVAASTGSASDAGTGTSAPAVAGSASETGSVAASASPTLEDLCRTVVATGNGWPSALKGSERATVIAAAGQKNNVLSYCTALVG
jgi:cytoskeletal protein RodZ